MYVTITSDDDNAIQFQRQLGDFDTLEPNYYADWYAAEHCNAAVNHDGTVPLGCGHFTVEIAEHPQTAVCWAAQSYFLA